MTFDEARAQFPVLDRYAYLQAGSVGPLARGTIEAMLAEEKRRGSSRDAAAIARFMRLLEAREELRAERRRARRSLDADQVALTASTTDGCNIVLAGLDLRAGDEVITTTDEHFGLLGPLHTSGATVVVSEPDPERIVAAVTPRTRLIALSHVLWTTGAVIPVHELRASTGPPDPRRRSAVGRRDDRSTRPASTSTRSPARSGCVGRRGPVRSSSPTRTPFASAGPSYLSQDGYEQDGAFEPKEGAARFDPNLTPGAAVAGLRAAIARDPSVGARACSRDGGAVPRATRRRRARTSSFRRSRATLVSWRAPAEESATIVERLADAGSDRARSARARALIRASVGWWTNDDDLERLVAAL